ncbi:hypothetical protein HII31_05314 [Pseudocercospora fuligena]|uniref:Uncharacterized protein n=1 Tax=Pseudocercospora fuligena TaxID=685502 RepID=A0A8H6RK66_9PEZI|nr:hypothetical protein HII31_05314 [Pseudocercospora fuligena]
MGIAIDRQRSVTPIEDEASHENHNAEELPPWDQNRLVQMVQVPHLGPKTVPQSGPETYPRAKPATKSHQFKASAPHTASMSGPNMAAMPYETSLEIPNGPKTAPHVPAFVKAPPSPPDSIDRTSTRQASLETTERHTAPKIGLQGTMAHGEETYKRRKHSTRPSQSRNETSENKGIGKRLKFAMKDMFKREPAQDADCERIGDKHWTEE